MGIETGQSKIIRDIVREDYFGVGESIIVPVLKPETVRISKKYGEIERETERKIDRRVKGNN